MKLYLPTRLENYVNFVDEFPLLLLAEVVSSSNIDHVPEVSHAIESYGTFRTTRDRQITSTKELSLLVFLGKKNLPSTKSNAIRAFCKKPLVKLDQERASAKSLDTPMSLGKLS